MARQKNETNPVYFEPGIQGRRSSLRVDEGALLNLVPVRVRSALQKRSREKRLRQDLADAEALDVSSVRTLCLALGPYRSHASVTASIIATHPHGQAINHGGRLVLGDARLDLLLDPTPSTTDRFLRYGLHIALGRAGEPPPGAPEILTFLWSDPHRVSRHIRQHNLDLDPLLQREPRLRFLMTIRHPIACAYANYRMGTGRLFGISPDASVAEYLDGVLREILWFMELEKTHPDRFLHLHAADFGPDSADRLAAFLEVEAPEPWRGEAGRRYQLDDQVMTTRDLAHQYRRQVETLFVDHPNVAERLLAYLDD